MIEALGAFFEIHLVLESALEYSRLARILALCFGSLKKKACFIRDLRSAKIVCM